MPGHCSILEYVCILKYMCGSTDWAEALPTGLVFGMLLAVLTNYLIPDYAFTNNSSRCPYSVTTLRDPLELSLFDSWPCLGSKARKAFSNVNPQQPFTLP